jgi:hypothetical protein
VAARQADKGEARRRLVKADGAWRSLPEETHECASWERLDHIRGHAVLLILGVQRSLVVDHGFVAIAAIAAKETELCVREPEGVDVIENLARVSVHVGITSTRTSTASMAVTIAPICE